MIRDTVERFVLRLWRAIFRDVPIKRDLTREDFRRWLLSAPANAVVSPPCVYSRGDKTDSRTRTCPIAMYLGDVCVNGLAYTRDGQVWSDLPYWAQTFAGKADRAVLLDMSFAPSGALAGFRNMTAAEALDILDSIPEAA